MKFLEIFGLLLIFTSFVTGNLSLNTSKDEAVDATCSSYQVCNLVHNTHFDDNFVVEKLCDCPKNSYCPISFSRSDGQSISVNARTQMKFCTKIEDIFKDLPECQENNTALIVREMFEINKMLNIVAELTCKCDKKPVYWRHIYRSGNPVNSNEKLFEAIDHYECRELEQCETNDFCGLARTDYGFIFQRCTCNEHDRCRFYVEDSEIVEEVEELFYNELFFKSYCMRKAKSKVW